MIEFIQSDGKKEDLDSRDDFPLLDYEFDDDFDAFFKSSKEQTIILFLEILRGNNSSIRNLTLSFF